MSSKTFQKKGPPAINFCSKLFRTLGKITAGNQLFLNFKQHVAGHPAGLRTGDLKGSGKNLCVSKTDVL
jgi:hypothetical protein